MNTHITRLLNASRFLRKGFPFAVFMAAVLFHLATPNWPAPWETMVAAQATTNATTLAAAVTDTRTNVWVLSSATGITVGSSGTTWLLVDQEFVQVRAVSGTTVTVVRSSRPTTHNAGAYVILGPQNAFIAYDPVGACTATSYPTLPVVSLSSKSYWNCNNGIWQGTAAGPPIQPLLGLTNLVTGTQAYTAKVTDQIVIVTSAVAPGVTITVPPAASVPIGKVLLIKDGSGLLVSGSVVISVQGTPNQLDGNVSQILITTAYSFIKLVNTGSSWLKIW